MPRGRPRKTRITQDEVKAYREEQKREKSISNYKRKKTVVPGPWTEIDSPINVKATLRENNTVSGDIAYGTYPNPRFYPVQQKGWYPILINITSKSIKRDVEEHGLDNYVAACEKSLNDQGKYGTIIILNVSVDHSLDDDRSKRFLSCLAKTNKKSISGFTAIRKNKYQVLE